jgi:hypothetical protein
MTPKPTELEAENGRLKSLLAECHSAMIAAGWFEEHDDLMKRVRDVAVYKAPEKKR